MKISQKRLSTKYQGVYFKEIISEDGKIVDKQYVIRYHDADGKQKLKTLGKRSQGITPIFCRNVRNDILSKQRLGENAPSSVRERSGVTLDEAAERYFNDRRHLVKESQKEQSRYINHIQPVLGSKRLDNITSDDVESLQRKFTSLFAPRTTNHLIFLVGTIFKHAVKKGMFFGTSPTLSVDGLKVDNSRDRYLTKDEIDKLLEVCYSSNYELYLFVRLSLSTGGRVSTIVEIRAKDINLDNNSVLLKDTKNEKTYTGFYNDELKAILKERIAGFEPNDMIIKLHRNTISSRLKGILDTLFNTGLSADDRKNRAVIHTLRHTFASHLAINGTPILTIQKLMNHSNIEMTMRYAHLAPDAGSDYVKALYV